MENLQYAKSFPGHQGHYALSEIHFVTVPESDMQPDGRGRPPAKVGLSRRLPSRSSRSAQWH